MAVEAAEYEDDVHTVVITLSIREEDPTEVPWHIRSILEAIEQTPDVSVAYTHVEWNGERFDG